MNERTAGGRWVRLLDVRLRLMTAFGVLILLMAGMAATGAWRLNGLEQKITEMAREDTRVSQLVGSWLAQTKANAVRSLVLTYSDDPTLVRVLRPEFEATSRSITEMQHEVERLVTSAEGRTLVQAIGERRAAYLEARKAVLAKKDDRDAATALLEGTMLPAANAYVQAVQHLGEYYQREVAADTEAAVHGAATGRRLLAGLCAAGLLLALLASWLITRSVTQPVREAVAAARRVAAGDLSVDVVDGGRDELAQLLQALGDMTKRLRELLREVNAGAHTVADSSAQIAQGNADLSQRTESQASNLEETASAMEELTTTTTQNAEHARRARQLAEGASRVAREGGEMVGTVVGTMTGISEASRRIAEIIGVIDGIAFQTNLLALNAAVEAARAGEQGRGFAVVATEVRNLAQRSAAAAKEIKSLISESVRRVESGSQQVDAAGRKMQDIVQEVGQVSELVAEIALASQEQSSGIGQVNVAITQMDEVVQQNASLVEEAAAVTEGMKVQAETLLEMVARFRLGDLAVAGKALPGASERSVQPQRIATARAAAAAPAADGWSLVPAANGPTPHAAGWQEF